MFSTTRVKLLLQEFNENILNTVFNILIKTAYVHVNYKTSLN